MLSVYFNAEASRTPTFLTSSSLYFSHHGLIRHAPVLRNIPLTMKLSMLACTTARTTRSLVPPTSP